MGKKTVPTKKQISKAGRDLQDPKTKKDKKKEAAEILGRAPDKKK